MLYKENLHLKSATAWIKVMLAQTICCSCCSFCTCEDTGMCNHMCFQAWIASIHKSYSINLKSVHNLLTTPFFAILEF